MYNENENDCLLYANFNDDTSRLFIGTRRGFNIYKLDGNEVVLKHSYEEEDHACRIVESCRSYVIMVGSDENIETFRSRHLRIWSTVEKKVIHEKVFDESITACRINELYYMVSLPSSVYIYSLALLESEIPMMHVDSAPGLGSAIALMEHNIAYVDVDNRIVIKDILHDSEMTFESKFTISGMKFNRDHTCIAVVGDEGRNMDVFDLTGSNVPMKQFLRGTRPKGVHIPSFSHCGRYIALSSVSTAHIFTHKSAQMPKTLKDYFGAFLKLANPFSANVDRACVKIQLNDPGDTLIAFKPTSQGHQLELVMIKTTSLLLQCRMDMEEKEPTPTDWLQLNLLD